jgi:hypothetical protein
MLDMPGALGAIHALDGYFGYFKIHAIIHVSGL